VAAGLLLTKVTECLLTVTIAVMVKRVMNVHWLLWLCKCVRCVSLCGHFLSYSYVPPAKCHDHFHILSSSLFSNHSNVQ